MIVAAVFQDMENDPATAKYRGEHKFAALPSIDDRIVIGAGLAPHNDILLVVSVEHRPIETPTSEYGRQDPTVRVYAKWIGDEIFEE